eukprot:COSAG06_NODE_10659_length_1640_cov_2.517197_1_plen_78_part_00
MQGRQVEDELSKTSCRPDATMCMRKSISLQNDLRVKRHLSRVRISEIPSAKNPGSMSGRGGRQVEDELSTGCYDVYA